MKRVNLIFCTIALLSVGVSSQVFKVPDRTFPIAGKDNGFDHGLFALRQDSPSGLFIVYPKDNESVDQLKKRLTDYILPMFLHEEKSTKDESTQPSAAPRITSMPSHKGDLPGNGEIYLYVTSKAEVQILFYNRSSTDKPYVYGYFAYHSLPAKEKSKDWADANGNGVKFFDEFWKTISP